MNFPADDRILSTLKWFHQTYPSLDLRGGYVVIATILLLIGVCLIYHSISRRSKTDAIKKTYRKAVVFIIGVVLVFFAVFDTRVVGMRCRECDVSYTYMEIRLLGILLDTCSYQTHYTPEYIIEYEFPTGKTCFHSYTMDDSIKYWGGMIPAWEYELGIFSFAAPGASKEPVAIDKTYIVPKKDRLHSNDP